MKSVKEQWQKFRYKKTLLFGCFLLFVIFYDFTKVDHGLYITNKTDQNITLLKIVNDDREIVALTEKRIPLEPGQTRTIGCSNTLSVSAYGGSTLQVTVKNADHSVLTASCILNRPNNFFTRVFGSRYYEGLYNGSEKLLCSSHYAEGAGICEHNGINSKLFKLK